MLQTIAAVNQAVNNFIWGVPAMVCIIGVGLLLLAALLWFLPQLVVYPLLLLLVMSGLATTWSAIKRLRQYRRNPPPIKENDPLA